MAYLIPTGAYIYYGNSQNNLIEDTLATNGDVSLARKVLEEFVVDWQSLQVLF